MNQDIVLVHVVKVQRFQKKALSQIIFWRIRELFDAHCVEECRIRVHKTKVGSLCEVSK